MQIRLYKHQVDRLKAGDCSGAATIRYAVKRFNRGDFADCGTICNKSTNGKKEPLVGYPVKHRFDLPDSVIRQVLDWHWSKPDEAFLKQCRDEIERLDAEIDGMMKVITSVPYIEG